MIHYCSSHLLTATIAEAVASQALVQPVSLLYEVSVMVNGYKGPGSTNQTQIISKTGTHRSQQSTLLQLFFATQCYTSGSEIWDLHAKLGLFWDQIWT